MWRALPAILYRRPPVTLAVKSWKPDLEEQKPTGRSILGLVDHGRSCLELPPCRWKTKRRPLHAEMKRISYLAIRKNGSRSRMSTPTLPSGPLLRGLAHLRQRHSPEYHG
jgi:hypothetical protein